MQRLDVGRPITVRPTTRCYEWAADSFADPALQPRAGFHVAVVNVDVSTGILDFVLLHLIRIPADPDVIVVTVFLAPGVSVSAFGRRVRRRSFGQHPGLSIDLLAEVEVDVRIRRWGCPLVESDDAVRVGFVAGIDHLLDVERGHPVVVYVDRQVLVVQTLQPGGCVRDRSIRMGLCPVFETFLCA